MEDELIEPDRVLLLKVTEAARRLGIGRTKTYQLIADGRLEIVRIDGAVRIPVDAVEDFVYERRRPTQGRLTPGRQIRYGDAVAGSRPAHRRS